MTRYGKGRARQDSLDFKRILVAVDGSENSRRASRVALRVAEKNGAELIILDVLPGITYMGALASRAPLPQRTYDEYYNYANKKAREIVDKEVADAKGRLVDVKGLAVRTMKTIVQEIVELAGKENVDLIVVGTRGLGGFKKLLLGSVSSGVVTHADCSVLVVR